MVSTLKNKNHSFAKWPVFEGGVRSINYIFATILGLAALEVVTFLYALFIIGFVAASCSIVIALKKEGINNLYLLSDAPKGIGYGISETAGTVMILLVFRYGGDLAYTALFVSLSLILSGIVDPNKMHKRQWFGVVVYLLAAAVGIWDVLQQTEATSLNWIVFAFLIPVATTIEEYISKKLKKERSNTSANSDYVFSFWVNTTVIFIAGLGVLLLFDDFGTSSLTTPSTRDFFVGSVGMGVMSIFKVVAKVRSYNIPNQYIVVKNIIMFSVLFAGSALFGFLFFDQSISVYKFISWAIFVVAYYIARGKR